MRKEADDAAVARRSEGLLALGETPFTPVEAARAGMTDHDLRRLQHDGVIRLVLRGVYLSTSVPDSLEARARCLAKISQAHVVVVDRTAAWLWGVSAYTLAEIDGHVPLDAFSLRGHTRIRRPGVRGGARDLTDDDWVEVYGVKVTTPARTALDLACRLRRYEALAAMEDLMHLHDIHREDLLIILPRYKRRRGVVQARELVAVADHRAESQGESFTRLAMLDDGLPAPQLQVWVRDELGRELYRLDHAYEWAKVAIEYDGEEYHSSSEQRERDDVRREWLRSQGWIVIVVTKHDFPEPQRGVWLGRVHQALRERRPVT